jgi:hypothetical protein
MVRAHDADADDSDLDRTQIARLVPFRPPD